MTICFLSSLHPPEDKRVFQKEAIALSRAGFRVVHVAPAGGSTRIQDGIQIVTYPKRPGMLGRFLHLFHLGIWAWKLNAECYHCNEVDSWLVGLFIKLLRPRRTVIFDVHEVYPEEFAESRFSPRLQPLIAGGIRCLFRLLTPWTDRLVFAKESVAPDFPHSEAKQVLVRNYAALEYDVHASPQMRGQRSEGRVTRAIHLGSLTRTRGWPQLLTAMSAVRQPLELLIAGEFADNSEAEFQEEARRRGLADRISLYKWMPIQDACKLTSESDIGLILFQPGLYNHVHALPHKLFDYMLAGLPVIAPAFAVEVSRIVSEADCGILVDPSSADCICQGLEYLIAHPEERQRMGANGRKAVLDRYNWEIEATQLIQMYREFEYV